MFNLGQYVYQLLLTHQEVGVPGIGILKKERLAARFDESSNSFLPPSYSYKLLVHAPTDQLLVDYVSKIQQVSIEEASNAIDTVVEQLLSTVTEQGEATLDKIGYLREDQGNYQLISFDQQFWGLQPVAERITPEASTMPSKIDMDEAPIQDNAAEAVVAAEGPEEVGRTRSTWWIWAIATLVLLTIAGFYAWNRQNKSQPKANTITADTLAQPMANKNALDSVSIQATGTDNTTIDTVAKQEKEEPLVRKASKTLPYSIVVASFKTMELAIKQAEYFRTIGINAFVLESNMPNNRKKICYGSYPTKEDAQKDLEKVRKEIDLGAYIYPER